MILFLCLPAFRIMIWVSGTLKRRLIFLKSIVTNSGFPTFTVFPFLVDIILFKASFSICGQWEPFQVVCCILLTQPQWVCSYSPVHCLAFISFSDLQRFLSGVWGQVWIFVFLSLHFIVAFFMKQSGESLHQLEWKVKRIFEMIIHL